MKNTEWMYARSYVVFAKHIQANISAPHTKCMDNFPFSLREAAKKRTRTYECDRTWKLFIHRNVLTTSCQLPQCSFVINNYRFITQHLTIVRGSSCSYLSKGKNLIWQRFVRGYAIRPLIAVSWKSKHKEVNVAIWLCWMEIELCVGPKRMRAFTVAFSVRHHKE